MRLALLALAVTLTVGCSAQRPAPVGESHVEYMFPDRTWTAPVRTAAPPDPEKYASASIEDQSKMNGDAYNRQTKQLGMCNANLEAIRLWEDQIRLETVE